MTHPISKISQYLAEVRAADAAAHSLQTVAELASDLAKPIDALLEQLAAAGVAAAGPDTVLTEDCKSKLLDHLRSIHSPQGAVRKKLAFASRAEILRNAILEKRNGAEWEALWEFSALVIWGAEIEPDMQQLANTLLAKAVIAGKLPPGKQGRPVRDGLQKFGKELARAFWDMRDGGVPYKVAIEKLSEQHHRDERHLMRIINKFNQNFGETLEERNRQRVVEKQLARMVASAVNKGCKNSLMRAISCAELPPLPELTKQEFFDRLEELLRTDLPEKN